MVALPPSPPSRPTLRKLLGKLFALDADFDAFVIDCFPWVKQRMAVGPDRIARVNLLFEMVTPDELWAVLCRHYEEGLRSHPDLLLDDAKQSAAARQREVLHRELTQLQEMLDKCRELGVPTDKIEVRMMELRRKLRIGRQVGEQALLLNRYRLLEKLGEGGFATVWQARDCDPTSAGTELEVVAIKTLLGHHHDNEAMLRRFERGARMMRELEHPHIVRVLDGPHEDDELHFFVMEYLPGGDLRQGVHEKRLSEAQCIAVILQVGGALQHAHDRGRVHRDVTPANILLDRMGNAKLCDFDLVLPRDSSTMAGRGVHGTLAYAPPEQLGRNLAEGSDGFDPRADVYALGMTTLYALTGHEIPVVERALLLTEEISRLRYGEPLKAVLRKALEWKADARYPKVAAFCTDLLAAWERRAEGIAVAEVVEVATVAPSSIRTPRPQSPAAMAELPALPIVPPALPSLPIAVPSEAPPAAPEMPKPVPSAGLEQGSSSSRRWNWRWAAIIVSAVLGALGLGRLLEQPEAVHGAFDLGPPKAQVVAPAPVSVPHPSDLSVAQSIAPGRADLGMVAEVAKPTQVAVPTSSQPPGIVRIPTATVTTPDLGKQKKRTPTAASTASIKPSAPVEEPVSVAAASDIPVAGVASLTPSERAELKRLLEKFPSLCGKFHSLLTSLRTDPSCKRTQIGAAWMAKKFSDGFLEGEVEEEFNRRFIDPKCYQINTRGAHFRGDPLAPVTLVEFADFRCAQCAIVARVLMQLLAKYKNVKWVFMNYPHPSQTDAVNAAAAALAAGKQGKFWEYHDHLFKHRNELQPADLLMLAEKLKLDRHRFEKDQETGLSRVRDEIAIGASLDLEKEPTAPAPKVRLGQSSRTAFGESVDRAGIPTLFINCRKVVGSLNLESLSTYVEMEMAK